jgi:multicomponent K+:H+ antiporter subunit D
MIHGGGSARTRSGIQYIAFNLVGSSLFLFALALLYSVTGTLNMADLAAKLPSLPAGDQALLRVAAVMLILVFAIKGALVPLQFWLPGTYANAPGVVAALFAVMTKVGAYATLRFGTVIFPPDLAATGPLLQNLLQPAALVTLAVGAIGVLGATTLPRLAAFAGIASMGTAFLAISAFTPQTTAAALYYILHSTLATAALFLVADLVARRRTHVRLADPAPMTRTGLIASLFMAAAIANTGMPPLSGFIGKLLILDAFRDQAPLVWTVILVSSFLMILGLARAGSQLFWKPAAPEDTPPEDPGPEPLAFAATFALLAGLAALTVFASPVTDALTATAEALHAPQSYIAANRLGATP